MTTTTILCTDGSELANLALAAGLPLLATADRTMLVTVVEPQDASLVTGVSGFGTGVISPEQFSQADDARRQAAAQVVEEALRIVAGHDVEGVVIEGDPGRAIVDLATEVGATVVVMGSRGHGGLRRAVLGSVSDHVVRNAPCSVLITS
ncbi:MAG: universal stress protein [Ilumatobacteraceae bacterium]